MMVAIVMSASLAHLTSAFHPHTTFHSPSFHVYIEDTDAYGVMYNANYLRAYERALHTVSFKPPSYVTSFRSDGDDHDDDRDDEPDPAMAVEVDGGLAAVEPAGAGCCDVIRTGHDATSRPNALRPAMNLLRASNSTAGRVKK